MKKIIWIIVVLAIGGYFVNSYLEKRAKHEAERSESLLTMNLIIQTGPPGPTEYHIDFSSSQLPVSDKWLYVDPVYTEILPS